MINRRTALASSAIASSALAAAATSAASAKTSAADIEPRSAIGRLERLPRGLGIMADDWGAAGYAAVCLAIARGLGWL